MYPPTLSRHLFLMREPDCQTGESTDPPEQPADIRFAAMNLLARREHSLQELRQKLSRRFDNRQWLETELQRLVKENLQSDDRFAESFARMRALRGCGPGRVRQEMREKGISDQAIARAFEQAELDWTALAEAAYRKKFGKPGQTLVAESPLKEKARRARFMQYRGFSTDHYQHLIDY